MLIIAAWNHWVVDNIIQHMLTTNRIQKQNNPPHKLPNRHNAEAGLIYTLYTQLTFCVLLCVLLKFNLAHVLRGYLMDTGNQTITQPKWCNPGEFGSTIIMNPPRMACSYNKTNTGCIHISWGERVKPSDIQSYVVQQPSVQQPAGSALGWLRHSLALATGEYRHPRPLPESWWTTQVLNIRS